MTLASINTVFPAGWPQIARRIKEMRGELFGVIPDLPAIDITGLNVPRELLTFILDKNKAALRSEADVDELIALDSPASREGFFDDQLLEVISSIQDKYRPEEFVGQLVQIITKFLNVSAAFRTGSLQSRIGPNNANQVVSVVQQAWEQAADPDTKTVLDLLVTDLTYGGEEPWVAFLDPRLRAYVDQAVARQSG